MDSENEEGSMRVQKASLPLIVALALAAFVVPLCAQTTTPIFIELNSPDPVVVARYNAAQAGQPFDENLYRASVRLAQDQFLQQLVTTGIPYTLTGTLLSLPTGAVSVPDRYTDLINGVRLEVSGWDVGKIRQMSAVKQISVDVGQQLVLNHSVPYIRANCVYPDTSCHSARTQGLRGMGTINTDGSATGQVIAVLDTGIFAAHPMFDTTKTDAQFNTRTGDLRPVRLSGAPFSATVNHPKVVYRFLSGGAVEGDDTGHGTMVASTAAGLLVQVPNTDTTASERGAVLEGVAPGALLMDYKVCPSLLCNNQQILMALEDSIKPTDPTGINKKPVATVVNMSFGNDTGNPYEAIGTAAGNLQFAGVFPEASAGNSGPTENSIGSPAANRRVIATAATNDPGAGGWSADVLDPSSFSSATLGSQTPLTPFPAAAGQRQGIQLFPMQGSPPPPPGSLAQYYVFVRNGQLLTDFSPNVSGRIALVKTSGALLPATFFAQVANNAAAAQAVAVLFVSGVQNPTAVTTTIPAANIAPADGQYLISLMPGSSTGDPPAGTISSFPIRINPPGVSFDANTAGFSSRGPNNDFKVVKPDITAPGVNILMGASPTGIPVILGDPDLYNSANGTSFSGPHVAGAAALVRDSNTSGGGRPDFSPSLVRAALMNSATNLRLADNTTPISDSDKRNFIHETGAGLVEMVRATNVKAVMGTNELNGVGGSDDPKHPDFLPSYSYGELPLVGTGLLATNSNQRRTITVTVADLSGAGGSYNLTVVDASSPKPVPPTKPLGTPNEGDVTAPLTEPGFSLSLSQNSLTVSANGRATFDVTVAVDGTSTGLQLRCCAVTDLGLNVEGVQVTPVIRDLMATEFLWYVVATRSDGTESLRMPFSLRAVQGVPGGGAVGSTTGGGAIMDDGSEANFGFNARASSPPSGHLTYDATSQGLSVKGSVATVSVSGNKASFAGPCTLKDGSACQFKVSVEDNADPGNGADRFTIQVTRPGGTTVIHS